MPSKQKYYHSDDRARWRARLRGEGGEVVYLGTFATYDEAKSVEDAYRNEYADELKEDRKRRIAMSARARSAKQRGGY